MILEVNNLSKHFGTLKAVDQLSLSVEKGEFFAFLGPNGAGKSTTINMCTTLLQPTEGEIIVNGFVMGKQDDEIRKSIGVVFQYSFLDDLLTVKENMRIRAGFYGLSSDDFNKKYEELDALIGLNEIADKPYGKCSGGQRRRADIARALIHSPKLLFLDEPTTGLDPQTRKRVWDVINNIRKNNQTTIFLTTHYMEEAERADRVAIIDQGKLVVCDTPSQLKRKYTSNVVRILPTDMEQAMINVEEMNFPHKVSNDVIKVYTQNSSESLRVLDSLRGLIDSFEVLEGNMDTVFITLTGKNIRED
jgi:multidrug/hemolysin transport system ATP-binding protein